MKYMICEVQLKHMFGMGKHGSNTPFGVHGIHCPCRSGVMLERSGLEGLWTLRVKGDD